MAFGEELATVTVGCAELIDCGDVNLVVGPVTTVPGELLALCIHTNGTLRRSAPTVWLTDSNERMPGHVACYVGAKDQGECGIQATLTYSEPGKTARRNAGELLAGREVVQVFRAPAGHLAFVSPVFASWQRDNAGSVTISLHRISPEFALPRAQTSPRQHPNRWQRLVTALRTGLTMKRPPVVLSPKRPPVLLGEQLAKLTVPCAELSDCEGLDFAVGTLTTSPGELLALRICTDTRRPGFAPTVWLTEGDARIPGHVACYAGAEDQGEYGIQASLNSAELTSEISVPRMILYSPVSQCNLNCIHCISAHTRTTVNRLPGHIKARVQEWSAAGQLEMLASDYSGDILWADSRFGGELDFIDGLGIPFHIDTNGVCLTAAVSERLCRMRIVSLNISLDAAREETFKRVRKGAPPLCEVVENVARLLHARAGADADFKVSLSFTLMRSTLKEWPEFLRMGARLGVDSVLARHLEAYTAEMEQESLWHDQAAFNDARREIAALAEMLGITSAMPAPFSGIARTGRRLCTVPWHAAVVLGNGDVAACCVPGLVMGNLNETSMQEIWNGPLYRELRATVNSDTPLPPCATCPMFRHTDNPDSYLIYSALQRLRADRAVRGEVLAAEPVVVHGS
jgi:MoaA/NifB/PqqE/SkfB family radical SAM enzyme